MGVMDPMVPLDLCDPLFNPLSSWAQVAAAPALLFFEERSFYPKNLELLKRSSMPETKRYKQYEILQRPDGTEWELGSGAMGTTYKAFDTNLERAVALKIINQAYLGNDLARQQFLREARSAAGLRHPNIASVYDLGVDQDQYFYVMELINGITVKEKVQRDGPFNSRDALELILQIAAALSAAERQHLVHRDLKPANLMLTDENGEQVVKIIDFGLAKKILPAGEISGAFTIAGGFVGTAEFASPEQIREADLDARSDIYSLGATLFFMLAGRPPFTGAAGEVMSHHLYKAIPLEPLSNQPSAVIDLVQRMMEKDREKRPQNAAELRQLIESSLRQLTAANGPDRFRLIEPREETLQGEWFRALDERSQQPVDVFIFNRDLASDATFLATLRMQTELVRNAAHPLLRGILSLEETAERTFLVEEGESGLALQELLRKRQQFTPAEVAILLTRLAPLADCAQRQSLSLLDLTLRGIRLRDSAATGDATLLLDRHLDSWKALELKVDPIDLSLIASNLAGSASAATWQGGATLLNVANTNGPRSSYLRLLSLLGYELMGGQRSQVERTGRMSPLSQINEEANLILRKGAVDEFGSATEMANAFKRTLETHFQPPTSQIRATVERPVAASRQPPPGQTLESKSLPPSRPVQANQSTVAPSVLPPPLPVLPAAGPGKNLSPGVGPSGRVRQPADRTRKSIWQRPIVLIGAALFVALCLGALACYFTIQELVRIAADNGSRQPAIDKQETPVQKQVEPEKQEASLVRTLSVPGQYATIQSAIDAAKSGDTVLIKAGVYNEKLKFKDGIILSGESRDTTIIRYAAPPTAMFGDSSYDAPLEIRNCKSGQVKQLSFEQTEADSRQGTTGGNICRIDGVIIRNSSVVIRNCRATSAAACGIDVSGTGSAPTLIENQCRLNAYSGILFEDGAEGTAENNICEQNQADGIWVVGPGSAPNLTNNVCRSNKREGIFFVRGAHGRAEQNVCEQNDECGIGVFEPGTAPELVKNQCRSNRLHGIFFSHGAQGRATENTCESNHDSGIAIRGAMPFLSANTLRGNSHYGLAHDTAAKPSFGVKNQISGNKLGEILPNTVFK
jgi:parallel beta-helix repeat protein